MAIKSYIKHMSDMSGEKKNNTAHGASSGKFGNTGNVNDVNKWRQDQMNKQREKDSQMGRTPADTSGTGGGTGKDSIPGDTTATTVVKSPYDDYIKAISSAGNYDDGYWTKISNQLLANNRYGLNKADAHEKYYTDLVESYKNQNPLETDWGKAIMSQYGLDGDNAANAEYADAASSNSGNIDSYAEANARRQKLSYLNSGVRAVNDASNQRFSNMLGALEKMGVNTQQLLGISTSSAQSAMDAAKNRYSDDTTATVAYNNMVQKVLPSLLAEKYNTGTAAITPEVSGNIGTALQDAYDKGGEQGLLSAGAMIVNQYGQSYPDIEDIVKRYTDIISGAGGNTYYSGETESSDTKSKYGSFYPLMMFKEKVGENGEISDLPTDIQNKLRKEAEALGISATKYAKGLLTGDYTTRWLADIDPV